MMEKGFFASLFDLSFSEFVTIRLIKVLYILAIAGSVLGGLGFIVAGFSNGAGVGILFLLLSPLVVTLYILMARIWLELIIVVFRIAENTGQLVKEKQGTADTASE